MKKAKILSLILAACLLLVCGPFAAIRAAGAEAEAVGEISPDTAMENFVSKLTQGNYVIDAEGYLKTTVVSPEQVLFTHSAESMSDDYAFVTLEGETFEGVLDEDGLSDVIFVSNGSAVEALGALLPNGWITVSEGNMFNLFYNNVDNPLEFTSKEESVKLTLLSLGGYGQYALSQMEEVHMLLDAEDPGSVHFTAVINDNPVTRISYDDLDLTLVFGAGESDPRIDAWLAEPVYPPTRTDWTEDDVNMLDIVFFRDFGRDAVPFPAFASYAMNFDDHAYDEGNKVRITDAHGTEKDLKDYVKQLLSLGYKKASVTLADGSSADVYRRVLREDYRCYVQLYPYYDDGFVLEGTLYYDNPVYDSLAEISDAVSAQGFPALEATDLFTGWHAVDTAASRSEGWAYFFDYDLYMQMTLGYTDREGALAYLQEYGEAMLEAGFAAAYAPGEDSGKYDSANGFASFRYYFSDDDTVTLEFKKEKSLSPEEVMVLLAEHGLPAADIHGDIACRDQTRYHYVIGQFRGLFLFLYQPFDSAGEAEAFLDDYTALLDEEGYLPMDPQKLGSQRQFLFFNEELAKYVAFDFFPGDDGATVNFEFVSIEPEEVGLLQSAIGY